MKYINGQKLVLKNPLLGIAYQQSQKAICFRYVDKTIQNNAGLGFNSLASYVEPFWQDGRHTGKIQKVSYLMSDFLFKTRLDQYL